MISNLWQKSISYLQQKLFSQASGKETQMHAYIIDEIQRIKDELSNSLVSLKQQFSPQQFEACQQQLNFCDAFAKGNFKYSILIKGRCKAGKSTFLNAFLGVPIYTCSSSPETYDFFSIVYDKNSVVPSLYKSELEQCLFPCKNDNYFNIQNSNLQFVAKGMPDIYKSIEKINKDAREINKAKINQKKNFFVIKYKITELEQYLPEFILNRLQFIDVPGFDDFSENIEDFKKISDIYYNEKFSSEIFLQSSQQINDPQAIFQFTESYQQRKGKSILVFTKIILLNIADFLNEQDKEKYGQLSQLERIKFSKSQRQNQQKILQQYLERILENKYKEQTEKNKQQENKEKIKQQENRSVFKECLEIIKNDPFSLFFVDSKIELIRSMASYNDSYLQTQGENFPRFLEDFAQERVVNEDSILNSAIENLCEQQKSPLQLIQFLKKQFQPNIQFSNQQFIQAKHQISKITEKSFDSLIKAYLIKSLKDIFQLFTLVQENYNQEWKQRNLEANKRIKLLSELQKQFREIQHNLEKRTTKTFEQIIQKFQKLKQFCIDTINNDQQGVQKAKDVDVKINKKVTYLRDLINSNSNEIKKELESQKQQFQEFIMKSQCREDFQRTLYEIMNQMIKKFNTDNKIANWIIQVNFETFNATLSLLGFSLSAYGIGLIVVDAGIIVADFGWAAIAGMSLTPVGWTVLGVAAIGAGLGFLFNQKQKENEKQKANEKIKEVKQEIENQIKSFQQKYKDWLIENESSEQQLNNKFEKESSYYNNQQKQNEEEKGKWQKKFEEVIKNLKEKVEEPIKNLEKKFEKYFYNV